MNMVMPARPRGLIGAVRADVTPQMVLDEMKKALHQFRAEVDEELKNVIKKGDDDVVRTEKIDRINKSISELEANLKEVNRVQAALTLGGGAGTSEEDAAKRDHAQAFNRWFRKGADAGLSDLEVKAQLTTNSDPDGGYVVPTEVERGIDQILREESVMRRLATTMTINTDEYRKLVNMGGASSGWVGETETGSARPATSTPTMRELIFNLQEVYSMPATTQKMLDFAVIDVAAWLADEVRYEFADQESQAFISGDGVRKPRGLWDYDKKLLSNWSVGADWGKFPYIKTGVAGGFATPSATVSPADFFVDMMYGLKPAARSNGAFLMNDTTVQVVRKMKWNNTGEYIWREPDQPEGVPTMFGKPVYSDDYVPVIADNAYPVAFGNFARTYMIFDAVGIRVLRDNITQKGKVLFYTTKRVGAGAAHFQHMIFGSTAD